jgi:hypothetical protein
MDKRLFFLVLVFFLVFSAFSFTAIKQTSLVSFIRAKEEGVPSAEKSIIIAWPLTVNSLNNSQSKVSVFIRNNKELPISNKAVRLLINFGTYSPQEVYTDKNGKAEFFVQSNVKGSVDVGAIVDNTIELKQKVNIKFD